MELSDLSKFERTLLKSLEYQPIQIGPKKALSVAQSFDVTTDKLLAAINSLRDLGYVNQESEEFTGGAVVSITVSG
jgi:hypothetical protein